MLWQIWAMLCTQYSVVAQGTQYSVMAKHLRITLALCGSGHCVSLLRVPANHLPVPLRYAYFPASDGSAARKACSRDGGAERDTGACNSRAVRTHEVVRVSSG